MVIHGRFTVLGFRRYIICGDEETCKVAPPGGFAEQEKPSITDAHGALCRNGDRGNWEKDQG